MLVRVVEAAPYVDYPRAERRFPAQGIVLLTGLNGAGKSSVYEMVSWCLYGETVRGAPLVNAAVKVSVDEGNDSYLVERSRGKRGSAKLSFKCGPTDLTLATPTETQRRIDETFGSFEQFKASRIFARDLLAKLALATDKEAKGLLEELLGLQKFDKAYKLAHDERQQADVAMRVADALVPSNAAALAQYKTKRDELLAMHVQPADEMRADVVRLEAEEKRYMELYVHEARKLSDLMASQQAAERQFVIEETNDRTLRQNVQALEVRLERLQEETHCMTCGQEYDKVSRADSILCTEELLKVARDAAADRRAYKNAAVRLELVKEEVGEQRPIAEKFGAARIQISNTLAALRADLKIADSLDAQRASAEGAVLRAEAALAGAQALRDEARAKKLLHDAACEVLGLKGARCLLLARALNRLEVEANVFLAQVHPELRVVLVPPDETDKLSIKVKGAGGGVYRSCSGGQKALVDVALMLGLAALRGGDGLLVFDEVFDSMDAQRVEVVAQYLQQVARTRQCLVISHREDFSALFRTAARWKAVKDADGVSTLEDA